MGWLIYGQERRASTSHLPTVLQACVIENPDTLEQVLRKQYEMERVPEVRPMSVQDRWCIDNFDKTYCRDETGRFVVKLPLIQGDITLGDSYKGAYRWYVKMKAQMAKNPDLEEQYNV